jgi:hypothetical protein
MKNLFLLLIIILLATACSQPSEKPANLLPKETMVRVMADMHFAEAKVKNMRVSTDSARHVFSIYELKIFDRWNISPEQYTQSYEYYLTRYDEMTAMQAALIDTLSRRQQQVSAKSAQ